MWIAVDPLAEKYPSISPYNYCNSNPVRYIDPDGRDWYENNKTHDIMWKDSTKNIKGFKRLGDHYVVGQANFIPGTKTYIDRNYTFHKNGSISVSDGHKNELQRIEDGKSIKSISGPTYTSSATSVSGLAVQANFTFAPAITPGFTASFGYVKDSYGNGKFYYSYGKSIGLAVGIGGDFIPIKTTDPNKLFKVQDFQGYGNSYSGGVGASVNYGGSTDVNTTFMQNINPNAWGRNKGGYTTGGVGYGFGLDVGAVWTRTNTKFINPDKK